MLEIVFGCVSIELCRWRYLMPHRLSWYLVKTSPSVLHYLRVKLVGRVTWMWKIGQMMEDVTLGVALGRKNK